MRKRIAVIHDLVSYGGAALMNIIPISYSLGIEVCPIPTSLFTSHGGFDGVKVKDNSDFMKEYLKQYIKLELSFDGIYLGLFITPKEIVYAKDFLDHFSKNDNLIVLDPILGDNGSLYSFMNNENVNGMKELVTRANIITPNLTEAFLILGENYKEKVCHDDVVSLLERLSSMGPKNIIITSVPIDDYICIYILNKESGNIEVIKRRTLKGSYPGAGDAFTSIVMCEVLQGKSITEAAFNATKIIEALIKIIINKGYNPLEGLPIAEYLQKKITSS